MPTAIIIGASSGIGEALAHQLARQEWRLGLAARRVALLEAINARHGGQHVCRALDMAQPEQAAQALGGLIATLGAVDLVIICAGTGELNPDLTWALDRDTLAVNVAGFVAVAQVAMNYFRARGAGHLAAVTSVAALKGSGPAAAYAASKAFESLYLDGLRDQARRWRLPIVVTEAQPGFVKTAMMKDPRAFWAASAEEAAAQILRAIARKSRHAYVTRRWTLIAWLFKLWPRWL